MARTRVRFGRIGVLLALLVLSVTLIAQAASGRTEHAGSGGGVHVVEAGDTLWDIARDLAGDEGDPRPVVERIRDLNELGTAAIHPGMRLRLPEGSFG